MRSRFVAVEMSGKIAMGVLSQPDDASGIFRATWSSQSIFFVCDATATDAGRSQIVPAGALRTAISARIHALRGDANRTAKGNVLRLTKAQQDFHPLPRHFKIKSRRR
ncbi:MAG: hypothetical protein ACI9HH_002206, partial [Pseudomonadota bacterium]